MTEHRFDEKSDADMDLSTKDVSMMDRMHAVMEQHSEQIQPIRTDVHVSRSTSRQITT